jgi:hypothetical protein
VVASGLSPLCCPHCRPRRPDGSSQESGHRHRHSLSDSAASAESLRINELQRKGDFPVTEKAAAEIVSLPMFPQLTAEQQARRFLWPGRNKPLKRLGEDYRVKESIFPLLRLDDLNLSPDFVKIDVQGWELNVLRGARETILRSHPVLVIERNRHNERDTTQYLEGLGYRKVDEARLRQDGAVFANESGDSVFVYQSAA